MSYVWTKRNRKYTDIIMSVARSSGGKWKQKNYCSRDLIEIVIGDTCGKFSAITPPGEFTSSIDINHNVSMLLLPWGIIIDILSLAVYA
jgi:hypothetical protein